MAVNLQFRPSVTTQIAEVTNAEPLPVTSGSTGKQAYQEVAFDGSAGNGAMGTVALFTVSGLVALKIYAECSEDLAGATATVEVGTATNTAALIAQTTATDIDSPEIWHDGTPDASVEASTVAAEFLVNEDVIVTVGTANVTDGTLNFIVEWRPIESGATVTAA